MPCWYYDKKNLRNTMSVRDGIEFETEQRYRKEGARFIMQCGTAMGLGHNTVATGVVYFHRFYMFHSFRTFPRYVTACCCLFLAGKVEETPKKCMDIIKTARSQLTENAFKSFGDDPKEEVMTLERILLQTIKFDLQVEHPYSFLLKYAKCLKGDKAKLQKMVQMAWNFVNDSLSTTLCLQWEPEIIAVAMIHLASKLSKFIVDDWTGRQSNHLRWWDMFVADVTMEILEDICHQVLDLYQQPAQPAGSESPPQLPPSKASPPSTKRLVKKPPLPPTPDKAPIPHDPSALDNQPIPKLITTGENMHYQYASTYANMYAHSQAPMHAAAVAMYANPNQYAQPPLPTSMQPPAMPSYPQNQASNYYQPPLPPPPTTRMPNYYHGPT